MDMSHFNRVPPAQGGFLLFTPNMQAYNECGLIRASWLLNIPPHSNHPPPSSLFRVLCGATFPFLLPSSPPRVS